MNPGGGSPGLTQRLLTTKSHCAGFLHPTGQISGCIYSGSPAQDRGEAQLIHGNFYYCAKYNPFYDDALSFHE